MMSTRMAIRFPLSSMVISILTWREPLNAGFGAEFLFEALHLFDTLAMPVQIRKSGVQVSPQEFRRKLGPDDARTQAEHVHAVILNTLMRGKRVVAGGGADAPELIGCHASARS